MKSMVFALVAMALPFNVSAQTCEASDFKPRVLLIGENHCDNDSIAAKAEALKLAAEGKVLLVMENLFDANSPTRIQGREYPVGPKANIRGMESEILHGLVISYMTGTEFRHACFSDTQNRIQTGLDDTQIRAAVQYFKSNRMVRRAWDELPTEVKTAEDLGDMAAVIAGSKDIDSAKLPTSAAISRLYRRINVGLVKTAQGEAEAARIAPGLLALQTDDQAQAFNQMARSRSTPALDSARDEFFSSSIQSYYCQAAAEKRNMVVIMGAFHLKGVMEGLPEAWNNGIVTVTMSDRDPLKASAWNEGLKTGSLTEDQMRRTQQVAMVAAEAVRLERLAPQDKQYRFLANKFKARTMIFINHARDTGLSDDQIIAYAREFLLGRDVTRIEVTNSIVVAEADVAEVIALIETIAKMSSVSK